MLNLVTAGVAACCSTLLRGFQNKSVAAGNKPLAFIVGGLMNVADVLVIASVARTQNWQVMACASVGAATGWVLGMTIHDLVTRKQREAQRRAQKEELKRRMDKRISKFLHAEQRSEDPKADV